MDASKIAQELQAEQEQSGLLESETKNLETIVKNLHVSKLYHGHFESNLCI